MEIIGVLDAAAQHVNVPLIVRAIETVPATQTITSHPTQYEAYCRAASVLVRITTTPSSDGIDWKQSVDMPADCIHLETPDGVFLIKNLAT